jgi:hypothetical protein
MKSRRYIFKKVLLKIGAFGMLSILLMSCLKNNYTPPPPTALLTVIQALADEPPLNFFLNGNQVNQSPFIYGNGIDYFSAYAGQRTANFYDQSMNTILSAPITLAPNAAYSLFLTNVPSKPEILLLTDTLNKPAAGNASVRFVDLSPDAPAADLAVQGGSVLVSNRSFMGYSSFSAITANSNYTFVVRQTGTNTVLATLSNVSLSSGYVYTILFEGLSAPTNSTDNLSIQLLTNAYF